MIASDIQGPEAAIPWIEKAGGKFRALIDRDNVVGTAYQLKYVPVGIFVDEDGRLVRAVGGVDIRDAELREDLEGWAATGTVPDRWIASSDANPSGDSTAAEKEALARFQLSRILLESGKRRAAVDELKRAFNLDRENWIIRKQLWALENPEVFYDGKVDYVWQKAQIAREDA